MIEIVNPKQSLPGTKPKEERIFPYYAGYSEQFTESIIERLNLPQGSLVLDPWNGSGTTCVASYKSGCRSIGNDLNPAMAIVAKASFVSCIDVPSLIPLAHSIVNSAKTTIALLEDPLEQWFDSETAGKLRGLEAEINKVLVSEVKYRDLTDKQGLEGVSSLAAFFYVVLFRITRRFVTDFIGTNPTWIKTPKASEQRKALSYSHIKSFFLEEVRVLVQRNVFFAKGNLDQVKIQLADACNLGIESNSIDAIITSPPYCTRIDYAVATSLELALLRLSSQKFNILRRALTGTSTVEPAVELPSNAWGKTCLSFLDDVRNHTSRASKTYYYKSHVQYYRDLFASVSESARVCKKNADLVFVVQSSYYKDIFNDLAGVMQEMGAYLGLELHQRANFPVARSMSDRNVNAKKYEKSRRSEESVLIFKKK
ncbi:DNA methyltransferase [Aeromonas hydrophila]|uniref:DNA methyltransferase n=1 Tax=Aeromonas hydrophila TaxID=644 RepID=UPI0030D61B6C